MPSSNSTAYRRKATEMREAAFQTTDAQIREIAMAAAKAYTDIAIRLERETANKLGV